MNEVVVHPGALKKLFEDPAGPVAKDLLQRGALVTEKAQFYVSGQVWGVQTDDLRTNFYDAGLDRDGEGLYYFTGTTAIHNEFGYPRYLDRQDPWLTRALREVFP